MMIDSTRTFSFIQQPTGSSGNLNELFSGLLTTNQQQQQPMRINQLNLTEGYASSNLIEQSKTNVIRVLSTFDSVLFLFLS